MRRRASGLRTSDARPSSNSKSPNRLYSPVTARESSAVRKSWSANRSSDSMSKSIVEPDAKVTANVEDAIKSMAKVTASVGSNLQSKTSKPVASASSDSSNKVALAANRIADRFNEQDQGVGQVSRITNVEPKTNREASKIIRTLFRPIPPLGESTLGESTLGESTLDETTLDESKLGESTLGETTKQVEQKSGWQSQEFSLGKTLDRFRSGDIK